VRFDQLNLGVANPPEYRSHLAFGRDLRVFRLRPARGTIRLDQLNLGVDDSAMQSHPLHPLHPPLLVREGEGGLDLWLGHEGP
jgi:hypothetical protein